MNSKFCQGEAEEVTLSGDWHVPTAPEASKTDDDQEAQSPEDGDLMHAYLYNLYSFVGVHAIVDVHWMIPCFWDSLIPI